MKPKSKIIISIAVYEELKTIPPVQAYKTLEAVCERLFYGVEPNGLNKRQKEIFDKIIEQNKNVK